MYETEDGADFYLRFQSGAVVLRWTFGLPFQGRLAVWLFPRALPPPIYVSTKSSRLLGRCRCIAIRHSGDNRR